MRAPEAGRHPDSCFADSRGRSDDDVMVTRGYRGLNELERFELFFSGDFQREKLVDLHLVHNVQRTAHSIELKPSRGAVFRMMKKPRELIEFLFGDSQQASEREMLTRDFAHIFEEMERQEELEPKKTPLKSVLSKVGIKAELNDDFTVSVDEPAEYRKIKAKLSDPETMEELAELGWVVSDCGDVAMTGEECDFRFRFTEITQDEPENAEKRTGRKDLEAIVKAAKEFSYSPKEEQPDPKKGSKTAGVGKPKAAGNAEHAIKDSMRRRATVDQMVNKLLED